MEISIPDGIRLGCVKYTNAKPLIHGLPVERIQMEHPARLTELLLSGELDVALVPVVTLIENPELPVVDNVSIAADGEVASVFLAYRGDLSQLNRVYLDSASRTSVELLRIVLKEHGGIQFEPGYARQAIGENEGVMLIGDQAIEFRSQRGDRFKYLDLGTAWLEQTGFPFVFAVWLMRGELEQGAEVADVLREAKEYGTNSIAEIAGDSKSVRDYLTKNIRYDLDGRFKAGMGRFLLQAGSDRDFDPSRLRYI